MNVFRLGISFRFGFFIKANFSIAGIFNICFNSQANALLTDGQTALPTSLHLLFSVPKN